MRGRESTPLKLEQRHQRPVVIPLRPLRCAAHPSESDHCRRGPAGLNHGVSLAQYSLDTSARLHETCIDSTGTPQMDVSTWLRDLGLENYLEAFRANDIDAEVLPRADSG